MDERAKEQHYQCSRLLCSSYFRFICPIAYGPLTLHRLADSIWQAAPSPGPSTWDLPWSVGGIVLGLASHKVGSTFHTCIQSIVTIKCHWKPKTTYLERRLMNNRGGSSHVKALNVKNQSIIRVIRIESHWIFRSRIHESVKNLKASVFLGYTALNHTKYKWVEMKIFLIMNTATSCENLKFLLLVDMSQSLENPLPRLTMLKFLTQHVKAKNWKTSTIGDIPEIACT